MIISLKFCGAILTVALFNAEFVGLSLSYGLSLNAVVFWAIWVSCFIENRMVSVERIKQFTNIPFEAPWRIKDCLPSPNWPTKGDIDIKDLKVIDSCQYSCICKTSFVTCKFCQDNRESTLIY